MSYEQIENLQDNIYRKSEKCKKKIKINKKKKTNAE